LQRAVKISGQIDTKESGGGEITPRESSQKATAVKSIYRAASILNCVSNGLNSITDIAECCKLSKSTVHRLLKALGESNLIVQDPVSREYYLGQLITRLISRPQITHEYLIACSNKEMNRLSDITKETICLGILQGLKYTGIREIPSKHQLRVVEAEPNLFSPLYAGAGGKTLLSLLSDKELKITLKNIHLEPITEYTNTDIRILMEQVNLIRQQRYCLTTDEIVMGAMCLAAPIRNYVLPASISIIGPTERLKPKINNFLELLLSGADRISSQLAETLPAT
jgi:IclR family transcriptional regulator, KDG regulon repressor